MADFSGSYDTTQREGYTELTVDPGSSLQIFVDEGEDFENWWIDMSASGASCEILTYRSNSSPHGNWSIRNVAMVGEHSGHGGWFIAAGVRSGSTGVIENVHIADGQEAFPDDGNPDWHKGGISYMPRGHEGHLIARNVWFQGGVDNGFYWSNGPSGEITIENCYSGPCHISNYRICGDVTIENSYADARISTGRGIWSWDGTNADVYDSHFHGGSGGSAPGSGTAIIAGSGSVVNLHDSQYSNRGGGGTVNEYGSSGNNPQQFLPEGCPGSPEAVFDGSAGEGPPEPEPPEDAFEIEEPDDGDPVIEYPSGSPQQGLDVHRTEVAYPSLTNMKMSDIYLSDVDGIAVRAGSRFEGAEVVLENIHVDGAEVGIVAEECPVIVRNSEIRADTPRAVIGDGEIISDNTNWGENATPERSDTAPASAEEAAGLSEDSSNP